MPRRGSRSRVIEKPLQAVDPKSIFTPRTDSQRQAVEAYSECDVLFLIGPAGTGKTITAAGLALTDMLIHRRSIVIVRPLVEAGQSIGYLPGNIGEKTGPYLTPFNKSFAKLTDNYPDVKQQFKENHTALTLNFMRGDTFDNTIAILDESQNATLTELKMFMTRIGSNSKLIITGDPDQPDLPGGVSRLADVANAFRGVKRFGVVTFPESDVVRHPIIRDILRVTAALERQYTMQG